MKKPNGALIKLVGMGCVSGLSVVYEDTDAGDTFCHISGGGKTLPGAPWDDYEKYLTVRVEYNYVASIKDCYLAEVAAWNTQAQNKIERGE